MQQGIQISSTVLPRLLFASFPVVCSEQFCLLRLYSSVAQFAWSIVCLIFWSFCNASGTTTFEDRLKQAKGQTDFYWPTKKIGAAKLTSMYSTTMAQISSQTWKLPLRINRKTCWQDTQKRQSVCEVVQLSSSNWLATLLAWPSTVFHGEFCWRLCRAICTRDNWTTSKTHKVELLTIRLGTGVDW